MRSTRTCKNRALVSSGSLGGHTKNPGTLDFNVHDALYLISLTYESFLVYFYGLSGKKKMKKADVADALFERVGISRKESGEIVEMTLKLIKDTLKEGESVKIANFGNFIVRSKRERTGRNPKTGQQIGITPRKVVTFQPSHKFKKQVAP